jgi:hypothetical protein
MNLLIATDLLQPLQAHVRAYGLHHAESGGFLLGCYEGSAATVLALAEGVGIDRNPGFFRVSGKAIDRLFEFADQQSLRVWAQVHAHPRDSFLSITDKRDGFRVAGFLSGVIPDYAMPPLNPADWGWWTFVNGAWQTAPSPTTIDMTGRVVIFDETGIR